MVSDARPRSRTCSRCLLARLVAIEAVQKASWQNMTVAAPSSIQTVLRLEDHLGRRTLTHIANLDDRQVRTHFDSPGIDLPRGSHDTSSDAPKEDQVTVNGQLLAWSLQKLRACSGVVWASVISCCSVVAARTLLRARARQHPGIPNERFRNSGCPRIERSIGRSCRCDNRRQD